jgi:hypothetical protein
MAAVWTVLAVAVYLVGVALTGRVIYGQALREAHEDYGYGPERAAREARQCAWIYGLTWFIAWPFLGAMYACGVLRDRGVRPVQWVSEWFAKGGK